MFQLIEKLRGKPDRTKKQVAFLAALLVAGLIFVVWLTTIYPDFRQTQTQEDKVANLEPSPLGAFASQLSSGISAIKDKFSQIKSSVTSFTTEAIHYSATSTATTTEQ